MQVLDVKVLSGHIRRPQHVLDVASVCCGLRPVTCLVGDDVLPEGGRGELVLLGRIHDHRAVLMRVVALHGVGGSPVLRMVHGRDCRTTSGRCLQR